MHQQYRRQRETTAWAVNSEKMGDYHCGMKHGAGQEAMVLAKIANAIDLVQGYQLATGTRSASTMHDNRVGYVLDAIACAP